MYKRCVKGLWDTSVPGIEFDSEGVSNYAKMYQDYFDQYPRGASGEKIWVNYLQKIKESGKGKRYDCIIGVSGGTDSSYLLHLARNVYNLNPLAVTFDNGWSSDVSVKNIKKMTTALGIDLETYVVNYEEMKDILLSYMKSGLPWVDFPTDNAIKSILFQTARREGVKYILIGHDFRSEGTQPNEWTYGDSKQIKYIQSKFGKVKLRTLPNISFFKHAWLSYIVGIKMLYPFFFMPYQKMEAQKFLIEKYDWEYYGGHHHENVFTRFAIAYWMKHKFGMDKRIITLSAQVLSGEISRDEAIRLIEIPPQSDSEMQKDKEFVIKKLGITEELFKEIWEAENRSIYDYPSYHRTLEKFATLLYPVAKLIFPQMPSYFLQLKMRSKK